jgi:uncharacterized protein GlcG (DUF336 family)
MTADLTLDQALALCQAALKAGRDSSAPPLAVAVLDKRASVKAVLTEDGLGILMPQIAVGKANAVLGLGIEGAELAAVASRLPGAMSGFSQLSSQFIAVQGAVMIRKGGEVVGAVGVTGDTAERDETYARAATDFLDLSSR